MECFEETAAIANFGGKLVTAQNLRECVEKFGSRRKSPLHGNLLFVQERKHVSKNFKKYVRYSGYGVCERLERNSLWNSVMFRKKIYRKHRMRHVAEALASKAAEVAKDFCPRGDVSATAIMFSAFGNGHGTGEGEPVDLAFVDEQPFEVVCASILKAAEKVLKRVSRRTLNSLKETNKKEERKATRRSLTSLKDASQRVEATLASFKKTSFWKKMTLLAECNRMVVAPLHHRQSKRAFLAVSVHGEWRQKGGSGREYTEVKTKTVRKWTRALCCLGEWLGMDLVIGGDFNVDVDREAMLEMGFRTIRTGTKSIEFALVQKNNKCVQHMTKSVVGFDVAIMDHEVVHFGLKFLANDRSLSG